jgi:XTP/dITP diphosphohydrolase
MKTINFVTSNKGKFVEVKEKFKKIDYKVVQKDLGYPEIQTDSLEEVAQFGVKHLKNKITEPFILEDAGLFIDTLKGFPGVYSKYVFHTIGCKGILKLLEGIENRDAVFRSVYAYYRPGNNPTIFVGETEGTISSQEKGENGFGYDPIFVCNGQTLTFAEMKIDEKNNYSHRGKAIEKLIDYLSKSI